MICFSCGNGMEYKTTYPASGREIYKCKTENCNVETLEFKPKTHDIHYFLSENHIKGET